MSTKKSSPKPPAQAPLPAQDAEALDAMLQGLLKTGMKTADPDAAQSGQRCGLVAIVGKPT